MPPRKQQPNGAAPPNDLEGVFRAIGSLTNVVEQHVRAGNTNARRATAPTPSTWDQFHKLHPLAFKGTVDLLEAEAWVGKMEKIFEVLGSDNAQKVLFAAFMLEGDADQWWKTARTVLGAGNQQVTWEKFVTVFYEKYFPESVRDQKEIEFLELEQINSVTEYEVKFTSLSRFAPHLIADEKKKARKFLRGLKPHIKDRISLLGLETYHEMVDRALKAEIISKES